MARQKKYFVNEQNTDANLSAPGAEAIFTSGAGGGGKGGGGQARAAVEAPNTLRSAAIARIVEIVSSGPIEGIAGGAQGIYIDNTPLQNPDLSYNFPRAEWDFRVGLPTQDYLPGFSAVEAEIGVNTPVSIASNNIVQAVSATNIDAVKVTMLLPQGLSIQDTTTGDLNGTSVQFRIDRRPAGGTFATVGTYEISGKTGNPYEAQYRIERPTGTGLWEVRVTRITADPAGNTRNATTFARITEIQDIKISYPNSALVGIAIDAESVGNEIPKRAYLVKGMLIKIPSNYNPTTKVYTGVWDGLLVNSTVAVDNPAWCLYDILTNDLFGADIDPDTIDKFSFYDAGVYCDESVSYLDETGATTNGPRFTFNVRIADRPDIVKLVRDVAGAMNASLIWANGEWKVIQDRPTASTKLITKYNTIREVGFTRRSSKADERHTAVNVAFNDRTDRYLQRVATVESTVGIGRYGYNPIDIAAYGCTTEAQAIRAGKWLLDTELNQTQVIEFQMSMNGFDLEPGQVITVFDDDYANVSGSGRISSVAGTTVTVKDPITLTAGSSITVLLADGSTLQEKNIVETSGTVTSFTIASGFAQTVPENADFVVTSAIEPQQFRIIDIMSPEVGVVQVKAVNYDPLKFARVEDGVELPSPIFSNTLRTVIDPPTALVFFEDSYVLPSGATSRILRVEWTAPTNAPKSYLIAYTRDSDNYRTVESVTTSVTIEANSDGFYEFEVFSRDFNNVVSGNSLNGSYTFTSGGATLNPDFNAVSSLFVEGTAALAWNTSDLIVTWVDNVANTVPAGDYKVEVLTTSNVLLEEAYVTEKRYTYPFGRNVHQGGPRGIVKVRVTARDASQRFANPTVATFTNAAPAAISGISTIQSFKGAIVKWTPNTTDTDLAGYLVWRGTTAGFTTNSASLVFDGIANEFTDAGLADSTTYYYKIAAYDAFSRNVNGTGLNVSTSVSVLTLAGDSTNEYRVTGVTWTPNSPGANQVAWTACTVYKSLGVSAGATYSITAGNATWTSGILYVYYTEGETIFRTTTTLSTAIADNKIVVATYRGGTNLEIGDGKAFTDGSLIIAGTVGAAQLVVGSAVITQTAQIANAIVANANITNATIETLKLKNGAVTDIKYVANTSNKVTGTLTFTGPVSTSGLFYDWTWYSPEWTSPDVTAYAGPYNTNLLLQIPRLGGPVASFSQTYTTYVYLQRWNGSSWVDQQLIGEVNETLIVGTVTQFRSPSNNSSLGNAFMQGFFSATADTRFRIRSYNTLDVNRIVSSQITSIAFAFNTTAPLSATIITQFK